MIQPLSLKALTRNEARILETVAGRIFPTTDTPGAVEAGAINYIDQALAGDYAMFLKSYRKGLREVDRHARGSFGKKFIALSDDERDAVLSDLEAGKVAQFKKGTEFFAMLRCHVLEGVFCEPDYGGNRGLIGWRLVGFPGQQFGYPDPYINKAVDLSPVAAVEEKLEGD